MKAILNGFGLVEIPYLLEFVETCWRVALVLILAWALWHVCKRLFHLLREKAVARGASGDEIKRIETKIGRAHV